MVADRWEAVVAVPRKEGVEGVGLRQDTQGTSDPFPEAVGAYPKDRGERPCLRGMDTMEDIRSHTQPGHLVEVEVPVAAMEQRQGHHQGHRHIHRQEHNYFRIQSNGHHLCRVCHGHRDHDRQPMGERLRDHGSNRREDGRRDAAAKERDHQLGHAAMASGHGQVDHRRDQLQCGGVLHRRLGHLPKVLA